MATHDMAKSPNRSSLSRRRMVQSLSAAGGAFITPAALGGAETGPRVAGKAVEIRLTPISPHTFRIALQPVQDGKLAAITDDGTLLQTSFGAPAATFREPARAQTVKLGDLRVAFTPDPLSFSVKTAKGENVQHIRIDKETAVVSFTTGAAP